MHIQNPEEIKQIVEVNKPFKTLLNKIKNKYMSLGTDLEGEHATARFSAKVFNICIESDYQSHDDFSKIPMAQKLAISILLDSGANVSLVTDIERLQDICDNKVVQIVGCTGSKETRVSGLSKEFQKPAVLVTDLKFDIASLAQLEEDHDISLLNSIK